MLFAHSINKVSLNITKLLDKEIMIMTEEIFELAIRSPKGDEDTFNSIKNETVKKLVSIKGVGPEREFLQTAKKSSDKNVYVGMTRYENKKAYNRALRNPGFMLKILKFSKHMDAKAGIFIKPYDDFNYTGFCKKGQFVEFALLKPVKGVSEEKFLSIRKDYLLAMDKQKEVVKSYTFKVTGGFKAKDSIVHFTVYQSKDAFYELAKKIDGMAEFNSFRKVFLSNYISFADVVR